MVYVEGMRISPKEVLLEIPANVAARAELLQDLRRIGCAGLYHATWHINNVGIVEEAFSGNTPR